MRCGMNLLLWSPVVDERHAPVLEALARLGYDGVEVPLIDTDARTCEALGRRLDDLGLARTAITVRDAGNDPISDDPDARRRGREANRHCLECCAALGADVLCGPFHSATGRFSGAPPTREERARAVDALREACEHAERAGVTLALEALDRFECYLANTMGQLARLVREVDHPRCRIAYDTFNAHVEERSIDAAIETAAPLLAHVHLAENDRSVPGTGLVDFDTTFAALDRVGHDGWYVVEAFGRASPELAATMHLWRGTGDEMDVARESLAFVRARTGGP